MIVFAIAETSHLVVGLFRIWRGPICIYIYGVKFFNCAISFVSHTAKKSGFGFPNVNHHSVVEAHQVIWSQTKYFL